MGVLALVACSSASSGSGSGSGGAGGGISFGGSGGSSAGGSAAGGSGGMVLTGGSGGGTSAACSAESQFVYVLDSGANLYKFDPPQLSFAPIGMLNCPAGGTPFSMAVDRNANAWVVYTNGSLFKVDTKTAGCTPTLFKPGQAGFVTFGMGFSTDGPGSAKDTLFVSQIDLLGGTTGLGVIDTQSLVLTPVGMYDQLDARAELTGTGDGKLFGAFEGNPWVVAQIDKSNAKILSQAQQTQITSSPGGSNFAFAFWGGSFWLFIGPGTSTDVYQYDPAAKSTVKKKTESFAIVGAGVSTCAPIKPPA